MFLPAVYLQNPFLTSAEYGVGFVLIVLRDCAVHPGRYPRREVETLPSKKELAASRSEPGSPWRIDSVSDIVPAILYILIKGGRFYPAGKRACLAALQNARGVMSQSPLARLIGLHSSQ